jgi:hypothetical protein
MILLRGALHIWKETQSQMLARSKIQFPRPLRRRGRRMLNRFDGDIKPAWKTQDCLPGESGRRRKNAENWKFRVKKSNHVNIINRINLARHNSSIRRPIGLIDWYEMQHGIHTQQILSRSAKRADERHLYSDQPPQNAAGCLNCKKEYMVGSSTALPYNRNMLPRHHLFAFLAVYVYLTALTEVKKNLLRYRDCHLTELKLHIVTRS